MTKKHNENIERIQLESLGKAKAKEENLEEKLLKAERCINLLIKAIRVLENQPEDFREYYLKSACRGSDKDYPPNFCYLIESQAGERMEADELAIYKYVENILDTRRHHSQVDHLSWKRISQNENMTTNDH